MTLLDTFNDFDRLSSAFLSAVAGTESGAPMDVYRDNDRYVLEADLPGVDPKSIDVTVENGWLTVQANREHEDRRSEGSWLVHERSRSAFSRSIALGDEVDTDHISADYNDGVLKVVMPLTPASRGRKIGVSISASRQGSQQQHAIASGAAPQHGEESHSLVDRLGRLIPGRHERKGHRRIPIRRPQLQPAS